MRFRHSPDEDEAAAITRLVDAPATEPETETVGPWADRPEIRRQIAAERHVAQELRGGGPVVPDRLVRAVEAKRREAYGSHAGPGRRPWLSSSVAGWRPLPIVAGLAAACLALVVVVVATGGSSTGPSIPAAAALVSSPSTGPAPAARSAKYLDVSYHGVTYPNYAKFTVPPSGTRTDHIGGRSALTVFYRLPSGQRLSYTVFAGRAVPLPSNARRVVYEGVPLHEFNTPSGLSVVTLVRHGRTCVLAAHVKPDVVLSLAAAPVLAETRI
jgi:hypothetical protein